MLFRQQVCLVCMVSGAWGGAEVGSVVGDRVGDWGRGQGLNLGAVLLVGLPNVVL